MLTYKILSFVKNSFKREIYFWINIKEVILNVSFGFLVFVYGNSALPKLFSNEFFYEFTCMICYWGILWTEICKLPTILHIEPFRYFIKELTFSTPRNTGNDGKSFCLEAA